MQPSNGTESRPVLAMYERAPSWHWAGRLQIALPLKGNARNIVQPTQHCNVSHLAYFLATCGSGVLRNTREQLWHVRRNWVVGVSVWDNAGIMFVPSLPCEKRRRGFRVSCPADIRVHRQPTLYSTWPCEEGDHHTIARFLEPLRSMSYDRGPA
jgi:hypothetical protein